MKKTIGITLGLVLVAGAALASNTGFKLNYGPLFFDPAGKLSNNNWISLPFFFFPNGNVGISPQNANDWCTDLNGAPPPSTAKITQIIRFDSLSDTPKTKGCSNTIKVFDLVPGEGYSVKPSGANMIIDIVGSHDDLYAPNKPGASKLYGPLFFDPAGKLSNNNWVSVPYHSIANNANDLCADVNGVPPPNASKVAQIIRFDSLTDTPKTKGCSNTIKVFDLIPGEGYSMKPATTGISVGINVY
jgi:hypothetical protein